MGGATRFSLRPEYSVSAPLPSPDSSDALSLSLLQAASAATSAPAVTAAATLLERSSPTSC